MSYYRDERREYGDEYGPRGRRMTPPEHPVSILKSSHHGTNRNNMATTKTTVRSSSQSRSRPSSAYYSDSTGDYEEVYRPVPADNYYELEEDVRYVKTPISSVQIDRYLVEENHDPYYDSSMSGYPTPVVYEMTPPTPILTSNNPRPDPMMVRERRMSMSGPGYLATAATALGGAAAVEASRDLVTRRRGSEEYGDLRGPGYYDQEQVVTEQSTAVTRRGRTRSRSRESIMRSSSHGRNHSRSNSIMSRLRGHSSRRYRDEELDDGYYGENEDYEVGYYRGRSGSRNRRRSLSRSSRLPSTGPDHHMKRHVAGGALAGASLGAVLANRNPDGKVHGRGRKMMVGAAAGALGAKLLRRAQSAYGEGRLPYFEGQRGLDDEYYDRHHSNHSTLTKGLGLTAAGIALAGAAKLYKARKAEKEMNARGRSRTRSDAAGEAGRGCDHHCHHYYETEPHHHYPPYSPAGGPRSRSRGARYLSEEEYFSSENHAKTPEKRSRSKSLAKKAAAAAAAVGVIRHMSRSRSRARQERSRSRSRSSSRASSRSGSRLRTAAKLGLAGVAANKLWKRARSQSRDRAASDHTPTTPHSKDRDSDGDDTGYEDEDEVNDNRRRNNRDDEYRRPPRGNGGGGGGGGNHGRGGGPRGGSGSGSGGYTSASRGEGTRDDRDDERGGNGSRHSRSYRDSEYSRHDYDSRARHATTDLDEEGGGHSRKRQHSRDQNDSTSSRSKARTAMATGAALGATAATAAYLSKRNSRSSDNRHSHHPSSSDNVEDPSSSKTSRSTPDNLLSSQALVPSSEPTSSSSLSLVIPPKNTATDASIGLIEYGSDPLPSSALYTATTPTDKDTLQPTATAGSASAHDEDHYSDSSVGSFRSRKNMNLKFLSKSRDQESSRSASRRTPPRSSQRRGRSSYDSDADSSSISDGESSAKKRQSVSKEEGGQKGSGGRWKKLAAAAMGVGAALGISNTNKNSNKKQEKSTNKGKGIERKSTRDRARSSGKASELTFDGEYEGDEMLEYDSRGRRIPRNRSRGREERAYGTETNSNFVEYGYNSEYEHYRDSQDIGKEDSQSKLRNNYGDSSDYPESSRAPSRNSSRSSTGSKGGNFDVSESDADSDFNANDNLKHKSKPSRDGRRRSITAAAGAAVAAAGRAFSRTRSDDSSRSGHHYYYASPSPSPKRKAGSGRGLRGKVVDPKEDSKTVRDSSRRRRSSSTTDDEAITTWETSYQRREERAKARELQRQRQEEEDSEAARQEETVEKEGQGSASGQEQPHSVNNFAECDEDYNFQDVTATEEADQKPDVHEDAIASSSGDDDEEDYFRYQPHPHVPNSGKGGSSASHLSASGPGSGDIPKSDSNAAPSSLMGHPSTSPGASLPIRVPPPHIIHPAFYPTSPHPITPRSEAHYAQRKQPQTRDFSEPSLNIGGESNKSQSTSSFRDHYPSPPSIFVSQAPESERSRGSMSEGSKVEDLNGHHRRSSSNGSVDPSVTAHTDSPTSVSPLISTKKAVAAAVAATVIMNSMETSGRTTATLTASPMPATPTTPTISSSASGSSLTETASSTTSGAASDSVSTDSRESAEETPRGSPARTIPLSSLAGSPVGSISPTSSMRAMPPASLRSVSSSSSLPPARPRFPPVRHRSSAYSSPSRQSSTSMDESDASSSAFSSSASTPYVSPAMTPVPPYLQQLRQQRRDVEPPSPRLLRKHRKRRRGMEDSSKTTDAGKETGNGENSQRRTGSIDHSVTGIPSPHMAEGAMVDGSKGKEPMQTVGSEDCLEEEEEIFEEEDEASREQRYREAKNALPKAITLPIEGTYSPADSPFATPSHVHKSSPQTLQQPQLVETQRHSDVRRERLTTESRVTPNDQRESDQHEIEHREENHRHGGMHADVFENPFETMSAPASPVSPLEKGMLDDSESDLVVSSAENDLSSMAVIPEPTKSVTFGPMSPESSHTLLHNRRKRGEAPKPEEADLFGLALVPRNDFLREERERKERMIRDAGSNRSRQAPPRRLRFRREESYDDGDKRLGDDTDRDRDEDTQSRDRRLAPLRRRRRSSDPSSDRPHLSSSRRSQGRSRYEDAIEKSEGDDTGDDDVEELSPRFDKDGRPLHGPRTAPKPRSSEFIYTSRDGLSHIRGFYSTNVTTGTGSSGMDLWHLLRRRLQARATWTSILNDVLGGVEGTSGAVSSRGSRATESGACSGRYELDEVEEQEHPRQRRRHRY